MGVLGGVEDAGERWWDGGDDGMENSVDKSLLVGLLFEGHIRSHWYSGCTRGSDAGGGAGEEGGLECDGVRVEGYWSEGLSLSASVLGEGA